MSTESMLHLLEGQLVAHRVLLRAMIETHPNRPQLLEVFEAKLQVARATTEASAVQEAYLDGLVQEASDLWLGL